VVVTVVVQAECGRKHLPQALWASSVSQWFPHQPRTLDYRSPARRWGTSTCLVHLWSRADP